MFGCLAGVCVCVCVPVGEVQYSLNGISSSLTDVTLKAGQQGNYNKHPVLLPLTITIQIKLSIHANKHENTAEYILFDWTCIFTKVTHLWARRIRLTIASPMVLCTFFSSEQLMKNWFWKRERRDRDLSLFFAKLWASGTVIMWTSNRRGGLQHGIFIKVLFPVKLLYKEPDS